MTLIPQSDLLGRLELGVELEDEVLVRRLEDSVDDVADEVFETIEELVEVDERTFGLQVGVFSLESVKSWISFAFK